MRVQYCGLSDSRVIAPTETVNGAVPGGPGVQLTFSLSNNYIIDTTVAPYTTTAVANVLNALKALPNGEFVDVTSTPATQFRVQKYGTSTGSTPAAVLHTVSTGSPPAIVAGSGASAAGIGTAGANDTAGWITATALASGNVANTPLVVVTFSQPYTAPPKDVDITPQNAASAAVQPYPTNITATGFTIEGAVAAAASASLAFGYRITG